MPTIVIYILIRNPINFFSLTPFKAYQNKYLAYLHLIFN
jgi:hypothetical protein